MTQEKIKALAEELVASIYEHARSELNTALGDAISRFQRASLGQADGGPYGTPPAPVPVKADELKPTQQFAVIAQPYKACKVEGCANVAVPRFRNFCSEHRALAGPPATGGKKKSKAKKSA